MYERLEVLTPGSPVVDVPTLRRQCRIAHSYDDSDLLFWERSARNVLEAWLDRAFTTQTIRYTVAATAPSNSFPLQTAPIWVLPLAWEWNLLHSTQTIVELPRSPVQSVTSVVVGDWFGEPTTLVEGTDYWVDTATEPGRVRLQPNKAYGENTYVQITYTAGYPDLPLEPGTNFNLSVPTPIQQSIRALVSYYYMNRGDVTAEIPKQIFDNVRILRKYDFGGSR